MTTDPRPVPGDGGPTTDASRGPSGPPPTPPVATPAIPFAEVRRRAVRAIAHAIRTPLSLVAAPLELLDAASELGDRERRHLATARANVGLVRDEFERLVEVARWPATVVAHPTDLADLLATEIPPLQSRLHDCRLVVDLPVTADCLVDRDTAAWALRLLVEDIATGVEPGARVEVSTVRDRAGAVAVRIRTDEHPHNDLVDTVRPLVDAARDVIDTQGGQVAHVRDGLEVRFPMAGPAAPGPGEQAHAPGDTGNHGERDTVGGPGRHGDPGRRADPEPDAAGDGPPRRRGTTDERPVVLMVEDDEHLRSLLEAALADDYQVVAVATAEEAFTRLREVTPDVVVCDVVLPGATGEELVEALQHHDQFATVPVVMLTGRTDEELRVRLLRSGADDYLTKPFAVAELRARIANLADRRRDASDLQDRLAEAHRVSDQLQGALDSRVVIEQAKAFVAADRGIGVEEAFGVLRRWARAHEARLHDVARAVVESDFRPR